MKGDFLSFIYAYHELYEFHRTSLTVKRERQGKCRKSCISDIFYGFLTVGKEYID